MAQNTPILGKIKSSESAASLDAKYGPYASKAAANAALGENGDDVITAGLTVGVTQSDGSVKEFWYQPDGQGGLQLVEKQVAAQEETDPTVPSWAKQETKPSYTASEVGAIPSSEIGVAGGVATLGSDGKVPQSQLPSYVDDVLEYSSQSSFPVPGESGKIYVALDTNKTYRWSGSAYVEISQSLALGETSSTAFAGDRGKAIEDKIPSDASPSNQMVTASDLSGKVDKVSGATPNNFASFDSNGGIKDSTYNAADFVQNITRGNIILPKQDGVVDIPKEIQTVVATPVAVGGDPSATLSNDGVLTLGLVSGSDGHNPNLGTFLDTDSANWPSTNIQDGDYIVVVHTDSSTPSKTIYLWDGDSWEDTREAPTAIFASGEVVGNVNIINDFTTGGVGNVFSAELGKKLNDKVVINAPTTSNTLDDIKFVDEENNVLAIIDENGIRTKNFNSSSISSSIENVNSFINNKNPITSPSLSSDKTNEVCIIDENQKILAVISEDGIRTKNFNPSAISPNYIGTITLANSDIITVLGSSFGETGSFPTNKHWSGIMSMFSDYRIQNLSSSGSNVVSNLYFIRSGSWNVQGKYVAITNNENINSINLTQYMEGLDNLCTTLIGMGKIPIVCTNYQTSQYFSMAIKRYAYEHNLMFWDCANYCNTLVPGINSDFDDGAHLRRRNAPMVAYAYLNYMNKMGNPYSSIKIFNIRNSEFSDNLDNLVYSNKVERAKLFREIKVSSTQSSDEYNKILNNTAVDFGKYGLVEITIPSTSKYVNSLKLNLDTNGKSVKVYIKNTLAQPYPNTSASSAIRFSVSDTISVPSVGDIYSYGGVDYTVLSVVMGENDYYCTIYCSPSTMPSSQTGTLNVVSQVAGSVGSGSIGFVMAEETSLDLYSYITADNRGHWVELTGENGSYSVNSTLFNGSIQVDKVSFLIESNEASNTFQIKDVSLDYDVDELKTVEPNKEFVWDENDYIQTTELIPEPTFGAVGTTTTDWEDANGNGIVSVSDYENKYPAGATSEILVSDTLSMNTTLSSSVLNKHGNMWLEIYCRYFPDAPIPYTQADDTEVNNNSYDFNTLYIKFSQNSNGSGQNTVVLEEEVGLMWKIVRIPICWFRQFYNSAGNITNMYLSLYSNNKGIEICKVSLKYED